MKNIDKFELHNLTDCTSQFSDQFFLCTMRQYGPVLLGIEELDISIIGDGVLVFRSGLLEEFNDVVTKKIINSPRYVYNLIDHAWNEEKKLIKIAQRADLLIETNIVYQDILKDYFNQATVFCAHRIYHSFPYAKLFSCLEEVNGYNRQLATEIMNDLQIPTRMTYYAILHTSLIKTAIQLTCGNISEIHKFIDSAGFLDTRTIKPAYLEDPEKVEEECRNLIKRYGRDGLHLILSNIQLERRKALYRRAAALDYVSFNRYRSKTLARDQLLSICCLSSFLTTFEERKHYWRIRLLRYLRRVSEKFGFEPQNTDMKTLIESIEKV